MNKLCLAVCLSGVVLGGCGGGGGSDSAPSKSSAAAVVSSSSSLSSTPASSAASSLVSTSSVSSGSELGSSSSARALALGADVSWVSEMEAGGVKFYNNAGTAVDLFSLLSDVGVDAIRLRVWVNPTQGWYNSIQDVVAKAQRAKALGQRVMIDFHYSDTWADPAHQTKPAVWENLSLADLKIAMANHTNAALIALKDAGVEPEWVQVGNETNDGFLWGTARPSLQPAASTMKNYAELTTAGYDAVKAVFPNALVVVHLANCHDNANFRWIFDGLKDNGGKFDVIGASSYPTHVDDMSPTQVVSSCLANLNDMVDRYQVPVMLTEVGMPWDHADAKSVVASLINTVQSVKNGKGLGVFYWEPQAYNGWSGYTLGAFTANGKPGAAMSAFTEARAALSSAK